MKIMLFFLGLITLPVLAQDVPAIGHCDKLVGQAVTLTLSDGQKRIGKIAGVDATGLDLFTSDGGCHVEFSSLTCADQKKFGFDCARAKAQAQKDLDGRAEESAALVKYNLWMASIKAEQTRKEAIQSKPVMHPDVLWVTIKPHFSESQGEDSVEQQKEEDLALITSYQAQEMYAAQSDAQRKAIVTRYGMMASLIREDALFNDRFLYSQRGTVAKGY